MAEVREDMEQADAVAVLQASAWAESVEAVDLDQVESALRSLRQAAQPAPVALADSEEARGLSAWLVDYATRPQAVSLEDGLARVAGMRARIAQQAEG